MRCPGLLSACPPACPPAVLVNGTFLKVIDKSATMHIERKKKTPWSMPPLTNLYRTGRLATRGEHTISSWARSHWYIHSHAWRRFVQLSQTGYILQLLSKSKMSVLSETQILRDWCLLFFRLRCGMRERVYDVLVDIMARVHIKLVGAKE